MILDRTALLIKNTFHELFRASRHIFFSYFISILYHWLRLIQNFQAISLHPLRPISSLPLSISLLRLSSSVKIRVVHFLFTTTLCHTADMSVRSWVWKWYGTSSRTNFHSISVLVSTRTPSTNILRRSEYYYFPFLQYCHLFLLRT